MRVKTADLLLHPVRLRIVQALLGRPMTPLELMDALGDVPQASLYRHVNHLTAGGLLSVVETRPVRGAVERTYAVVEEAVSLGADSMADVGPEEHRRYFSTFIGTLLAGFGRYLETGASDLVADGVGYHQTPMWLTDEELARLSERLSDVLRSGFANPPGRGRRRRLVSTVVFPEVEPSSQPKSDQAVE